MNELKLKNFDNFKRQLIQQQLDFFISSTSYTKTITVKKKKFLFTDEPTSPIQLKLINLSREDGLKFLNSNSYEPVESQDIKFYQYTDSYKNQQVIKGYKIDLTSAYWVEAMNLGIISPKTNAYYLEYCQIQDNEGNMILDKKSRLKALGSFATKKHIQTYEKGKMVSELVQPFNEDLRSLYLYICEKVSKVMQIVSDRYRKQSIYYYWDCLFFSENIDPQEVRNLLKRLGFNSTVEKSEFAILKGKYLSKLIDVNKKIEYPIKRTDLINS